MLITGQVLCDTNDLDLDDTKKQLADSVLEDVKKQLPNLDLDKAKADAPSLEDVEKTLREKCDKNGGEGAYDNFEVSAASSSLDFHLSDPYRMCVSTVSTFLMCFLSNLDGMKVFLFQFEINNLRTSSFVYALPIVRA